MDTDSILWFLGNMSIKLRSKEMRMKEIITILIIILAIAGMISWITLWVKGKWP